MYCMSTVSSAEIRTLRKYWAPDLRSSAKTVSFSMPYSASVFSLSSMPGLLPARFMIIRSATAKPS